MAWVTSRLSAADQKVDDDGYYYYDDDDDFWALISFSLRVEQL